MSNIDANDPSNSVPFDFYVDSDDKDIEEAIDTELEKYLEYRATQTSETKLNSKSKIKFRKTLKTLILNLQGAYKESPLRWVSVSLDSNNYTLKDHEGRHKLISYDAMFSLVRYYESKGTIEVKGGLCNRS